MDLQKAKAIADEIVTKLKPYCEKIEIAGSIRRQKSFVRDVDIVCIPSNQGQFVYTLQKLGQIKMGGQKLIRCAMPSITLDVYIATPESWAMLLLVRTGSAAHNQRLAVRAKQLGLHFAADGRGILRDGKPVAWRSEESIFEALGLPYKESWERE